jgi:dUTP pyrophosphatase
MQLKVKKLREDAKLPTKGHPCDAGIDFYSIEEIKISSKSQIKISTGIAIEIPEGCVGLVWDKSSIAFNMGLKTMGGVIDAGYRGEIVFSIYNVSEKDVIIEKGQKIAQLLIQKFEDCDILEVEDLNKSIRGDKGFGSTGKK